MSRIGRLPVAIPKGVSVTVGSDAIEVKGPNGTLRTVQPRGITCAVEGDRIECPLHGGCFEIKTGKAVTAPCTEDLKIYPVKVDAGSIQVGVPKG